MKYISISLETSENCITANLQFSFSQGFCSESFFLGLGSGSAYFFSVRPVAAFFFRKFISKSVTENPRTYFYFEHFFPSMINNNVFVQSDYYILQQINIDVTGSRGVCRPLIMIYQSVALHLPFYLLLKTIKRE